MATLGTVLVRLRELRVKHAWESSTNPQLGGRPTGEAYMYVVGFQSGLDQAEKLINQILEDEKKGDTQ